MSSANRVAINYIKEATLGTTPTTPAFKAMRYTGESLNYNIQNIQTAEIDAARMETDLIQVQSDGSGALNFELSYGNFDDWLESTFCSSWAAGVGDQFNLDIGTSVIGLTVQKHFQDMTTPQFHTFKGCVVNQASLRMQVGRIVEGSFSVMGMGMVSGTSQIAGASVTAANGNTQMNAVANLQNFSIGGVPYSGCISSINLDINNNVRQRRCVGSAAPTDVKLGRAAITGSMEFYFNESSNFNAYLAGTEFAISWDLVDAAGNKYTFTLPRAKFETGQVVAGGLDTDVMFSATWRALKDSVTGRVLRLTRDPV